MQALPKVLGIFYLSFYQDPYRGPASLEGAWHNVMFAWLLPQEGL